MTLKSLFATAALAATALPTLAQTAAPATTPAVKVTPAAPATTPAVKVTPAAPVATPAVKVTPATAVAETPAPAQMKLADINPAVRAYILDTVANLLDGTATSLEAYAKTGKPAKDMQPQAILPALISALEKTPTTELPADIKPFVDGVIAIGKQAGAELATFKTDAPEEKVGAAMEKYEQPMMDLVAKNPAAVALGQQLAGSAESLVKELGFNEQTMMEVVALYMASSEDSTQLPAFAAKLREIGTQLRAKK